MKPAYRPFVLLVVITIIAVIAAGERVWSIWYTPAAQRVSGTATLAATQIPISTATAIPASAITVTAIPASATATIIPPTATATIIPPTATATATAQAYVAYRSKSGDDVAQLAEQSGSTVELITSYNRLAGAIQPLRPLIIPQQTIVPDFPAQAIIVQRGANRPAVALTLDAGASSAPTRQMLDTLATYQVHVTFFLTGDWILQNPELTRDIVAEGHEVANHSMNHVDFRTLDDAQISQQLQAMAQALYETTGTWPAPYFRPPYGAYDERVLRTVAASGYLPIFWTLDSLDSVGEPKTAEFIVDRLTNTLAAEKRNGAILLAHCGNQSTADALPAVLDYFVNQGLIVTTISQIL